VLLGLIFSLLAIASIYPFLFLGGGMTCLILAGLLVLCVMLVIIHFRRLIGGRILSDEMTAIDLNGGEFLFDEPNGNYEVWVFCGVPFSRYNGTIFVEPSELDRRFEIDVPRRRFWFQGFRRDFSPIVWRTCYDGSSSLGRCRIRFDLRPTLKSSFSRKTFPTHDVEDLEVLIRVNV